MPPAPKPFCELQRKQRQRIVETISDLFQAHCPALPHATALLEQVFSKCRSFLPQLSLDNQTCTQIVGRLGQLRAAVADKFRRSRIQDPSISVAQLDNAVSGLPVTLQRLNDWGYDIGKASYRNACREPSALPQEASGKRKPTGRPSKVSDAKLHQLVRETLAPYLQESEKVIVVGRGPRRTLVLAKHLSKKRLQIYDHEKNLYQNMSKDTFLRILKIHFPHVKSPRRLTDVCCLAALAGPL